MSIRKVPFLPTRSLVLIAFLFAASPVGCRQASSDPEQGAGSSEDSPVAAVRGPSWLGRLGSSLSETDMGKMGGSAPAPPSEVRSEPEIFEMAAEGPNEANRILQNEFVLTGGDLYRINCQACHGSNGQGSPPEINSVLPVISALVALPQDQAIEGLQTFLGKPGPKMPPFSHLQPEELGALLNHLKRLLSVQADQPSIARVRESAARVGQHVVRGNCHICHAAVGPGGGNMPMMRGTVPPLARFSRGYRLETLENVVRYGATGMMGMMGSGERMPPLPYLTQQEVAAAYYYLIAYPPQP